MKPQTAGRRVLGAGAEELRSLMAKSRDTVLAAALIGSITGVLVAVLDKVIFDVMLEAVYELPLGVMALAPGVGLALSAVLIHFFGGGRSTTADEYVKAVPHPEVPFDQKPVPGRMAAAFATLGLGGAAGLEGPSIYVGSSVGAAIYERTRTVLRGVDRRAALVAGAAAGVAAIFKTPATGAIFALEVPFQEDLARRSLLPALVGAASGYTTFVAFLGTEPLFPVAGNPDLALIDVAIAAMIGLTCGFGARVFAAIMRVTKELAAKVAVWWRVPVAAVVMAGLVVCSNAWFDGQPLLIGPGYRSVEFALSPERGLWIIALLATFRVIATATTVGGGGVAGLFVPLVVQGALTGRLLAGLFGADNTSLYVVVGVAAFLGAGYRVPLSAVMFVAEATGRPGFVVPGLIASTMGQLVMGTSSVSTFQRRRRPDYFADRAALPISSVVSVDPATSRPGDSVAQFFTEHVSMARRRAVPVVDDDGFYLGLVVLDDALAMDPSEWAETLVSDIAQTDMPTGKLDWTLGDALRAMIDGEVDHLPVLDDSGCLHGMVTSEVIIDRAKLMDRFEQSGMG